MSSTNTLLNFVVQPANDQLQAAQKLQDLLDFKDKTAADLTQQLKDEAQQSAAEVKSLNDVITGLNFIAADSKRATLVTATCFQGLQRWQADPTSSKEQLGVWIDSGGHTAQSSPGINSTPHGTFTWKPGDEVTPARFGFVPGGSFDNIFIYERFPMPAVLPTLVVDKRTFSLNAADHTHINCLEWQQELTKDGKRYNMGWQLNFTTKTIRYFDYNGQAWKVAPVPFVDPGTGQFEVVTEHKLDETAGTTTHVAITVAGVRHEFNASQPATAVNGAADKYTVSLFQVDSDSHGDEVGVNLHKAEVRYI